MSGAETASNEENTPRGEEDSHDFCLCRAAEIVIAYVSCHVVMRSELPGLIESTYRELSRIAKGGKAGGDGVSIPPTPAVPIRSSVTADAIICLEDGKPFKSLRRHIKTSFNLTPDEYRRKWGLPSNYPMVAPNYSLQRSRLARSIGLGRTAKGAKRP